MWVFQVWSRRKNCSLWFLFSFLYLSIISFSQKGQHRWRTQRGGARGPAWRRALVLRPYLLSPYVPLAEPAPPSISRSRHTAGLYTDTLRRLEVLNPAHRTVTVPFPFCFLKVSFLPRPFPTSFLGAPTFNIRHFSPAYPLPVVACEFSWIIYNSNEYCGGTIMEHVGEEGKKKLSNSDSLFFKPWFAWWIWIIEPNQRQTVCNHLSQLPPAWWREKEPLQRSSQTSALEWTLYNLPQQDPGLFIYARQSL